MALTINNTTYAGEHAGVYIGAALHASKSLDFLTVIENIKHKKVINTVTETGLIVDQNCDFFNAGGFSTDEKHLTPELFQINTQFCKTTMLSDWQAQQLSSGAWNNGFGSDFNTYLMSRVGEVIAAHVETNVWQGNTANTGQWNGFQDAAVGTLTSAAGVLNAGTGALTAANIITQLRLGVDLVPGAVYGQEDLCIYMNTKTFRLYVQSQSTNGTSWFGMGSMNTDGEYTAFFEGVKIVVCPGMLDDSYVIAQPKQLYFGTDLVSDQTQIKILDMSELDGSDNLRLVVKFSAGTQTGIVSDCVIYQ